MVGGGWGYKIVREVVVDAELYKPLLVYDLNVNDNMVLVLGLVV